MDVDPSQFGGKEINEIQMYRGMCVINFTDGSCLEVEAEVRSYGVGADLNYTFTPLKEEKK